MQRPWVLTVERLVPFHLGCRIQVPHDDWGIFYRSRTEVVLNTVVNGKVYGPCREITQYRGAEAAIQAAEAVVLDDGLDYVWRGATRGGKTYVERRRHGRVTLSAGSLTDYAFVALLAAPHLLRLELRLDDIQGTRRDAGCQTAPRASYVSCAKQGARAAGITSLLVSALRGVSGRKDAPSMLFVLEPISRALHLRGGAGCERLEGSSAV